MAKPDDAVRIALVGMVSLAIAMGVGRFVFTPLLPLMQREGLVTVGDGGALASMHFAGYWTGAVLAARLPCSPKTTMRCSLIFIGLSTLAMGLTDSYLMWLVLRFSAGVFSAFALVLVSNFVVRSLAEADRMTLQGWVFSGVGLGMAVAGLATLLIMDLGIGSSIGWQIFGLASLVAALVLSVMIGQEIPHRPMSRQSRNVPKSRLDWSVVIAYGVMGAGYVIPATYLPIMARQAVQSPLIFGWAWPVFGAAAFASTIFAASLQKNHSAREIWIASQMVMALGLALPAIYPNILTIIAAATCVGGTFMIITMMGMKEAHRIAADGDVMRHISIMTAAFASGQIIGPVVAGHVHELTQGFTASLAAASVLLFGTAITLMGKTAGSPNSGR